MRIHRLLAAVLLVSSACSSGAGAVPGPTFVYHPADRLLPFPSDRYLVKDAAARADAENATGYRISTVGYEADPAIARFPGVAEGLHDLDGFGVSAEIAVGLTASLYLPGFEADATAYTASVAKDAPIQLFSIDAGDPQAGVPLAFGMHMEEDGQVLFIRPWVPLAPNRRYAVVFRAGLRDAQGRAFVAPAGFAADFAAARGQGLEGEGYARLAAVFAETPLFAVTFRTGSITVKLQAMLDGLRAGAPGAVSAPVVSAGGASRPHVAAVLEGWFQHLNFRQPDGKLSVEPLGSEWLRYTITLPVTSATVHEPFPVVLGQHGLNDKRHAVLHMADAYAADGIATLAIDAPSHGSRGPGEDQSYDTLRSAEIILGVWTDGTNITFKSWQFRDIIRQQVLDHLQVLRAIEAWSGDVDRPGGNAPGPDLDLAAPAYSGQSMGGIMGGVTGGMVTELKRVVLNVPGGRISNIFVRNQALGDMLLALLRPRAINMSDTYRMINLVQAALDPGDPVNYVARMAAQPVRPLLIQAAFEDGTVPNFTTFDLARAIGAPLVGPFSPSIPGVKSLTLPAAGITGADARAFAFFKDIVRDGEAVRADHGNLWASETALDQAVPFVKSGVIFPAR
jgi:hypothetical protein